RACSALVLDRGALLRRSLLAFQDSCPVEFDARVRLLDQPNRILVEGRTPNPDARWGPKPIQDSRMRPSPPPLFMNDVGGLVAELVAAEPEVGQNLLPLL